MDEIETKVARVDIDKITAQSQGAMCSLQPFTSTATATASPTPGIAQTPPCCPAKDERCLD
jgi:hypothetical protein